MLAHVNSNACMYVYMHVHAPPFARRTVLVPCAPCTCTFASENKCCVMKHVKVKQFQLNRASKLIRVESRRFSLAIRSFAHDASRASSKRERLRLRWGEKHSAVGASDGAGNLYSIVSPESEVAGTRSHRSRCVTAVASSTWRQCSSESRSAFKAEPRGARPCSAS